MANEQNLIPTNKLSKSEARKMGRNGGKRSGEVRREKKALRETLQKLIELDYNYEGQMLTGAEATGIALIQQALKGNVKAYEVIRDTLGEKPIVSVSIDAKDETIIAYEKAAAAIKGKDT